MLTPSMLREHAESPHTISWDDTARQLLKWAADLIEAADQVMEEAKP
jgi:hypothetical protein